MPKIEIEHLTKRWGNYYGTDDVSLVIPDNSFVTLLGPSGCGKTTILRMIAGLETPTSGKIIIGDEVVFDSENGINIPANKRNIGFLFQNYALWPNMTVYQNISFGLTNKIIVDENNVKRKYTKEEIKEKVRKVAELVKIERYYDRYPSELSGGQQQRVAIARTLAPEPKVLFMDEPLSNLDAKLRLDMRYELQRLHLETNSTFVYVTHDQMEAMTLATSICLLNNGVLQEYEKPLKVYSKPVNMFVADFVGNPSINFIDAKLENENKNEWIFKVFDNREIKFISNENINIKEWQKERDENSQKQLKILEEKKKNKYYIEKINQDDNFHPHIDKVSGRVRSFPDQTKITDEDFSIGIRPEFIEVAEDGIFYAEVFGSMPTGMETTLKLRLGEYLLTAVIFGNIDYEIGKRIRFNIKGNDILLFDRKSGKLITCGSLGTK